MEREYQEWMGIKLIKMKVYTLYPKDNSGTITFTLNPNILDYVIVETKIFKNPKHNDAFSYTLDRARSIWRESIKNGWRIE